MDNNSQETIAAVPSERTPLLFEHRRSAAGTVVLTLLCAIFAVGLVCGIYLILKEDGKLDPIPGKLTVVPKESWGANETALSNQNLRLPALRILLLQTEGPTCYNEDACSTEMQTIQRHYVNDLNQTGAMPNFMVGGDGRTYEGCGWTCKSDYTSDNGTLTLGLIGTFQDRPPTELQVSQIVILVDYSIATEKIVPCFSVTVHLQPENESTFLIAVAELLQKHATCY